MKVKLNTPLDDPRSPHASRIGFTAIVDPRERGYKLPIIGNLDLH
jgi:hypothetical protein